MLVDRLWPRGLTKKAAEVDDWMKSVAPSGALRAWFDHRPDRWEEFRHRYRDELASPNAAALLEQLAALARAGPLTLVYGARDEARNQAVVIAEVLAALLNEEQGHPAPRAPTG